MALIKKFRIKEFKNKKPIAKLEKISLSFDKRQILDDINFNLRTDNKWNIISSLVSPIDNLNTFYKSSYKNYILNDNSLIEFYVNKGVINIMKKGFNNNLKYDSKINIYPLIFKTTKLFL